MTEWDQALSSGWWPKEQSTARGIGPWRPGSYELVLRFGSTFRQEVAQRNRQRLETTLASLDSYLYVQVDEHIDTNLTLVMFKWPQVTEDGEVLFDISEDPESYHVDVERWQRFVDRKRDSLAVAHIIDGILSTRTTSVGDVFAVTVERGVRAIVALAGPFPDMFELSPSPDSDMALLLGGKRMGRLPLLDVTWDAFDTASAAHSAATAGRLLSDRPLDETVRRAARRELFGDSGSSSETS